MAKNMTRKGLAAGAGFALVSSALVVAPAANAVEAVQLAPTAGTSYNITADSSFELKSLFTNDAVSGGSETLKYRIVDSSEGLDVTDGTGFQSASDPDAAAATAGAYAGALDATDKSVVVDSSQVGTDVGTAGYLLLVPEADESFSVTVQAWMDFDVDDVIDSGEYASPVRTVNFIKSSEVTFTTSLTAPVLGAGKLEAEVTSDKDINLHHLNNALTIGFGEVSGGAYSAVSGGSSSITSGDFDAGESATVSTEGDKVSAELSLTIAAGTTYVAAAVQDSSEVSAKAASTVSAAQADAITDEKLVASADVSGTNVRSSASSVTYSASLTIDDGTGTQVAVGSGVPAVVTITETHSNSDAILTAGGETLEDGGTALEIETTTNGDGDVLVPMQLTDFADGDEFTIDIDAEGNSGAQVTVTFVDTAVGSFVDHTLLGTGSVLSIAEGSTYTLTFAALDNYDQPLTGNYRVLLDDAGAGDPMTTNVVNGVAQFSVTDSDSISEGTYTAQLQSYNTGSAIYENVAGFSVIITPEVSVLQTADTVTLVADSDTGVVLNNNDIEAANERLGDSAPTVAGGTGLEGQVSTGGLNTWSTVTLSSPGALFKVDTPSSKDVYSVGTAVVHTNATGAFDGVTVYGNTAGKITVTATAGGATVEEEITFAAAAEDSGANLVIDAPTAVEPGSTLVYTATLTDKYGNPVNGGTTPGTSGARFNYDGPGFVVGSLPTDFGADGTATVTIFLGNNDDGKTGTLTVSYTPTASTAGGPDDAAAVLAYEYDGDNDLVVQKTVNIGDAPLAAGEFNAWTKLIENDTAVKFYAKNPSNQGKIQFFFNGEEIAWHRGTSATSYEGGEPRYNEDQDAYYLVRDVELVSGIKNVFEIEQDGERIWRAVKTLD